MTVLEEINYRLRQDNAVVKIIVINVVLFVVLAVVGLFSGLAAGTVFSKLILPASLSVLLTQPWSVITYSFVHTGFLSLLFNMLWFYMFAAIFHQYLGNAKTWRVYLLGALTGAVVYIACVNVLPAFSLSAVGSMAWGASAGVLAIIVATATYLPNYEIVLFLIGPVRLKYVALISVGIDLYTGASPGGNTGGIIGHLGGAAFGFFYIRFLYKNGGRTSAFDSFFDKIGSWFKPKPKIKIHYRSVNMRVEQHIKPSEAEIDLILDKINRNGYNSLSKKEKEILEKASKE